MPRSCELAIYPGTTTHTDNGSQNKSRDDTTSSRVFNGDNCSALTHGYRRDRSPIHFNSSYCLTELAPALAPVLAIPRDVLGSVHSVARLVIILL